MGQLNDSLFASLLLSLLCFVLVMGIFFVYLILRWRSPRPVLEASAKSFAEVNSHSAAKYRHVLWKRPQCWLAVKNGNLQAVQAALALHNSKPCPWIEGVSGEGDPKLFVSPPVSGWILVMGPALPDPTDDIDICFRFLLTMSRKLGHIQFFNANAMLNEHAWALLDNGQIVRGYAWAGHTLWNQGEATPAEQDLRLKCYDYNEAAQPRAFGSFETCTSDAEQVHRLAARWSVDPDEIDERLIEDQWGIIGELSRRF